MYMVKRRVKRSDSFGLGNFDFGMSDLANGLKKCKKRATLSNNRMKGKMAEESFKMGQIVQGNDCHKIHKGGDFIVQKRDMYGNKVGKPTVHEIKTGNAKLSPAQKRRKKQLGRQYKEERFGSFF